MKFLLDQDVYAITARYLRTLGHDVVTAADLESSRASDEALLLMAQELGRIFVTRDRDFGGLANIASVHEELNRVLQSYSEKDLQRAFIVVESGRHRFRRLTP